MLPELRLISFRTDILMSKTIIPSQRCAQVAHGAVFTAGSPS